MTAASTPAQKPGFPSRNLTGQDRALFYPDAAALGCGHRAGSTRNRSTSASSEAQNADVAEGLRSGRPPPSPCVAEEPKCCGMNAEIPDSLWESHWPQQHRR